MANTTVWNSPDQQATRQGDVNVGIVYLVDPATGKVISPAASGGSAATDTVATGTLTAAQPTVGTPVAGGTVSITLGNGQAVVEVQLTGTFNAGTTLLFEGTEDSGVTTNWFSTFGQDTSGANPLNISQIAGGASKLIRIPAMGYAQIRVRANPFAGGDNVAVRVIASVAGTAAGSLSTNDGTFAKETGGNLATINTNTANIPAKGTAAMAASTPVTIATNDTNFTELLGDTDNLATIAGAIIASIMQININKVGGNAVAVGSNAVPVLVSAATGYVAAYGSNPTALTANTDAAFKWGAGGTTQVNHVMIQNNDTNNLHFDLDVAATAGSPILAPGQTLFLDVQTTTVHYYSAGTPNLNGTAANNVVTRGWL